MQYRDIDGVTLISVNDSQDFHFTYEKIEKRTTPKKHVIVTLGKGMYDGERKTIILADNRDGTIVFIQCEASVVCQKEFNSFVLIAIGQSIELIWSHRFSTWFIAGTGCNILNDWDFNRWIQDPISVDIHP